MGRWAPAWAEKWRKNFWNISAFIHLDVEYSSDVPLMAPIKGFEDKGLTPG